MKKLIIPLCVISNLQQHGVWELLRANGFDTTVAIKVDNDMCKFTNIYTQEGE